MTKFEKYIWGGPEMVATLEVEDLRAGYATGDVLQGVRIRVDPGEVVGVLGRNGVGKSTLMKAVIGLLRARSGTVRFKSDDITREGAHRRAPRHRLCPAGTRDFSAYE